MRAGLTGSLSRKMDERSWIVVKNAASAGLLKGGAMLAALAMVPAYLQFFDDKAAYGAWLTAVSIVNLILTLDFGVGNGMRNSLVAKLAAQDWRSARREIAGAYGAAVFLMLLLAIPVVFVFTQANVPAMTGLESTAAGENLAHLVAWLIATVALQFVLRNVSFVLYALQRAALNNLMALSTSLILLTFVLAMASASRMPNVLWLGPAYMGAVNLPLIVASLWVFSGPLRDCRPCRWREFVSGVGLALRSGRLFFLNQLLYTAILGTSAAAVALVAGPAGVVDYHAHYALFSIAGILATLALTPVWSAVTHAFVKRDVPWIQRALYKGEVIAGILCAIPVITALGTGPILDAWLGPGAVTSSVVERFAFVLFGIGFVLHGVAATFAAGLGKLRLQLTFYAIGFMLKVVVVLLATPRTDQWALIPAMDGLILLAYFMVERRAVGRWLMHSPSLEHNPNLPRGSNHIAQAPHGGRLEKPTENRKEYL